MTIKFIDEFRREFYELPYEDVAFPRGCKDLNKYRDLNNIYKKGEAGATPIHVRGALLYNWLLKQKKLEQRYPLIQDGDKIKFCYMKLPNPLRENVFACPGTLPRQLGLDQYIDYETQFEKSFVEPIKTILDSIGWRVEKKASLDDFFS